MGIEISIWTEYTALPFSHSENSYGDLSWIMTPVGEAFQRLKAEEFSSIIRSCLFPQKTDSTAVFTAALLAVSRLWNQPSCLWMIARKNENVI